MPDYNSLLSFLGWCTVLNFALLIISTVMLTVMKDFVYRVHGSITGLDADTLQGIYVQFLGNYKMAVIVFFAVPWLALKIMA